MMRLLVVLLSCLPTVASAATVCVNTTGADGCFPTIQQGVDAAASGDTVDVAAGTYVERVVVAKNKRIRLQGAGPAATIIDGDHRGTVLKIKGPNRGIAVTGIGIRNGWRGLSFGDRVKISVSDCTITGNVGGGGMRGGGAGPNATVTRCTITDNSNTEWGGGISIAYSPTSALQLKVVSSTIRGNAAAGSGGGIAAFSGRITLVGSSVDDNSAGDSGGGIFAANLIVKDSTISRNTSHGGGSYPGGGGIHTVGNLTVRNSTISGNSATNSAAPSPFTGLGGGLFAEGRLLLEHVTVANNTADTGGGGFSAYGRVTLKAALVGDNSAPSASDCNGADDVVAFRVNLIEDPTSCSVRTSPGGVVITGAPMLGPLQDNGGATETQALLAGSPAIGVVTSAAQCEAPDQRGETRAVPCDLGSYEAP